ncbi:MAG: hypothetical protein GTO08_07690 [Deltaproteobacteria bacterium]|nr:hypothetical protein [Deltaproteobacteria bacterium]
MVRVKTFTSQLKIFHVKRELDGLDSEVNEFLEKNGITKVISVSDTSTTGESGEVIGLIRVLAYEAP